MRDPERLSQGTDLSAQLLGSARGDNPSPATRARVAAAVGVGVSVGVASALTAGAASGAAAGTSVAATAKATGVALWIKVLAATAVTASLAGGAVSVMKAAPSPAATNTQPIATATATAIPTMTPTATATATPTVTATATATPTATATATPTATATATPTASAIPSTSTSGSRLARELRLLDDARAALARKDATHAISKLDEHAAAFPSGVLATEAQIVRVEALLVKGEDATATKLAEKVLAQDPSGPHAKRLRALIEANSGTR